nr:transposase (putative), gypsy type [Tanacetum cinerariifolium]
MNLDSLKNWNNCFSWIDATICPLSIPWFNGAFFIKDPLPVDDVVDVPCAKLLDENRTLIQKYPKIFLGVVGLSRSYTETDIRPTFLDSDN